MNQKALISNVITAAATAIVLGMGGWVFGVFQTGSAAIDEQQIKDVLKEVLLRDNGQTYAASLVTVETTVVRLETRVEGLTDDVDDLEDFVLELSSEN